MGTTYSYDSWVLGHGGRCLFLGRLLNAQILHIAPPKDNLLVDDIGGRVLIGAAFPALCPKGAHVV
jgi:hypothetical protein